MALATVNNTSEMIAVMHEITLRYCPCQFSRSGNCRVSMTLRFRKRTLPPGRMHYIDGCLWVYAGR